MLRKKFVSHVPDVHQRHRLVPEPDDPFSVASRVKAPSPDEFGATETGASMRGSSGVFSINIELLIFTPELKKRHGKRRDIPKEEKYLQGIYERQKGQRIDERERR
jgi:hypothetical protein